MRNAPEQRTVDVDVQDIDTRGRTLVGYAAVYGAESHDLGGFTERIAPGAFASVLDADVRALLNHDPSQVLGRTRSGTLRLQDEQRGLRFEVDLPNSPLGENVREAVRRGDIDGASFRFKVDHDSWQGDTRTIESVRALEDITVATFAAYPQTSVELRSRSRNHQPAIGQEETIMADQAEQTEQTTIPQTQESAQEAVSRDNQVSGTSTTTDQRTAPEERPQQPSSEGRLRVEGVRSNQRRGLADEFRAHGFPGESAVLPWEEFESRAVTWSASVNLMNQMDRPGGPFPYDQRWVYPVVPQIGVGFDVTSVLVAYQTARALATPENVVRAIDAVTTKPETGSTVNLVTVPLSQVATVQSGVPNVYAAQAAITSIIESDMRLAINDAIDSLVLAAITASDFQAPGTDNYFVTVRKAIATLQTAGFQPDVLVQTPTDALDLDVMVSGIAGGTADFINLPGNSAPGTIFGLQRRISKSAPASVVLDSSAFGKLYASPVTLARFEANNGLTNSQNLRLELNAAFGTERQGAAIRLAAS